MILSYDTKKEEEKNQIFAMYQEIFQDPELFAQYYFDMVYPDNRVLMAKKRRGFVCYGSFKSLLSYVL